VAGPEAGGGDVPAELVGQGREPVVGVAAQVGADALQDMPGPVGEVRDPGRHAVGVQRDPVGVGGRHQQLSRAPVEQDVLRGVRGHQFAVTVDDDRGVGHVGGEDVLERVHHGGQGLVVQRGLRVGGREPGRQQELVSFPQRQLERFPEPDDHLPARHRPAAFDEAQVPLGGTGPQGQLQLAQSAAGPPLAQDPGELHETHF
jgi:hypothetical protein